jgi:hypothetical protein
MSGNYIMDYETMIVPKGTLLFRGMNSTATLTSDFAGMLVDNKFCLHENYNVFFYPFPFVAGTVAAYQYTVIYVTTRDLKLVNLILPSKFNRDSRKTKNGGILSCDEIENECDVSGRDYDPCVDYTKVPKDVSGMVAIAKADAETLNLQKTFFRHLANKYFTTYKDSRNIVGVPEFILHPRIDKTPQTETIADFKPWYSSNKSKFNYKYLHVISSTKIKVMQDLMDEFMSERGLDLGDDEPYHLKVNKKTGFFQIEEFSNNLSELIAPDLKPTADMVLKQKSMYKTMSDKYPKADTIPASLNRYYVQREYVALNKDALEWLTKFMDARSYYSTVIQPLRKSVQHTIHKIDGKKYVFLPTPAGREIEKQARITKDNAFLSAEELTGHPINSQISAYEVFSVSAGTSDTPGTLHNVSVEPATHINGLLQYYAQKKGSIGASRRKTRRKKKTH